MRPKVLLTFEPAFFSSPERQASLARLQTFAETVGMGRTEPYSDSELKAALADADGLMRGSLCPQVTAAILDAAPKLRIIGDLDDRFSHNVDVAAAFDRNIRVVDTSNASSPPVAEWALALTILTLRNGAECYRQMIAGTEKWATPGNEGFVRGELSGKTVGILGLGHLGRRLVELLQPFHTRTLVFDPYVAPEVGEKLGVELTGLDELLQTVEVLISCVPLTPKTRGMIGQRELDLLRPGAVVINVSRGAVFAREPLIRKLQAREIIASFDVYETEPLEQDSPFRSMTNVFLSPHIASATPETQRRFFDMMVDEFERFFRGEDTRYHLTGDVVAIRHGRK